MDQISADYRYIKLTIEYDGTDFSGWQIQPKVRTVQEEIEKGLVELTKDNIKIMCAGRTDTGVHAFGQVASFRTESKLPVSAFSQGLKRFLPGDIFIKKAEEKIKPFNARKNAQSRTYRYLISKYPHVIGRQYSWYPLVKFSLPPMKKASKYLIGEHDFSSFFKKSSGNVNNCRSIVYNVQWNEDEEYIKFEITAKRFFHNMIRILMGTFIEVGRGRLSPKDFKKILIAQDRTLAGPTAPPHGLYLYKVNYYDDI